MKDQIAQKKIKRYKQTEIGVFPEDWDVKKLTNVASLKARIGWQGLTTAEYKDFGEYYLITGTDFKNGFIDWENCHYVEKARYSQDKNIQIKEHDVLVTKDGTIGKVALINRITKPATLNSGVFVIRPFKNEFFPEYFYYLLLSEVFFKFLAQLSAGSTINHLYQKDFINFSFQAPSNITEQTVIATVLSDTDALIESLEKLISKKKAIKQGAMQQLLTGKKRLPGFSREWEVKKLGDLLYYEQPTKYLVKDTEYNDNNDTPVLTAGKTFILGYTNEEFGTFNNIPVIIFDDFTTANKFATFPFKAKSSAMKILIPTGEDVNLRFVYEKMQLIDFPLGDHKRYWISEYQNLKIGIPKPEEQTAIATILSDMDAEIKSLEQKRDKYNMVKQGMMQQLLTGRIRIYDNN